LQEKRILYIQLDLNKTYVTKMYGTTSIKLKIQFDSDFMISHVST
jgi:hypothetical protein